MISLLFCFIYLFQAAPLKAQSSSSKSAIQNFSATIKEALGEDAPQEVSPAHVVHWKARTSLHYPDGSIVVYLNLATEKGFSLYIDHLQFTSRSGYKLKKILPPEANEIQDPVTGKETKVYAGGDFILHFQGTGFDKPQFPLSIRFVACSVRICLFPYTEQVEVANFKSTEDLPTALKEANEILQGPPLQVNVPKSLEEYGTFEERLAKRIQLGDAGFFFLLLALFLGGLLTNLTPCVYPMIPITIRLLSAQTRSPLLGATAYAGGIVLVYSILGLSVAYSGTLFGQYMASPVVNIVLAFIMFLLGFSMLGFGRWNTLARLGNKFGLGKPSTAQAFFMGCGAGLVASPCTGPILASILTFIIANKDLARSTLYIFTYSLGFALPYVVLGGLSGRLAKVRVSYKIQLLIKVVFAAVMFALSLYYLRIPFYEVFNGWKHYWQPIFIITLLLGLLLWRLSWLAHSHRKLHWFMILPGVLLGISLFSGTRWFFEEKTEVSDETRILWYDSEIEALQVSKQNGVPLLIDFWAEWCAACKKMDTTTFADPKFIAEAKKVKLIYLKIDVTQDTPANTQILEKYKVQGLPSIVIFKPGSDQAAVVSGYASADRLLNYLNE